MDLVRIAANRAGALVLAFYGFGQDHIRLFRERKEAKLGIIEEPVDKMELYQDPLFQQLGFIEEDLMIFEVIDIFYLERRHADLPDHFPWRGPELDIMWRNDSIGQEGGTNAVLLHGLVGEI